MCLRSGLLQHRGFCGDQPAGGVVACIVAGLRLHLRRFQSLAVVCFDEMALPQRCPLWRLSDIGRSGGAGQVAAAPGRQPKGFEQVVEAQPVVEAAGKQDFQFLADARQRGGGARTEMLDRNAGLVGADLETVQPQMVDEADNPVDQWCGGALGMRGDHVRRPSRPAWRQPRG